MNENNPLVCVIDDESSIRESLSSLLRSAGLKVQAFSSAQEFLASAPLEALSCLVLDVRLPGISGLDLQQELVSKDIQIPIIFLTGHGDVPMSVRAIKAGAIEFMTSICWRPSGARSRATTKTSGLREEWPKSVLRNVSERTEHRELC
jgi:FixJ family two-component response regulator